MKSKEKSRLFQIVAVGLAMFAMYFGAGNVVFPLLVGQVTQDQNGFAMIGLLVTAVGIPFTGLFAMTLYDGDYRQFFGRLGKWPGFFIALLIMAMIGPFGGIPRCIALAYSTTKMFFPMETIVPFSISACLLVYLLSMRKSKIMDIVGWILTPFFLFALFLIIGVGLFIGPHPDASSLTSYQAVVYGLQEGYNTMDLLGSFFFCSVVIAALKKASMKKGVVDREMLLKNGLLSCFIGAALMAVVYIGMSFIASLYAGELQGVSSDVLLGTIALRVLGPYAGIITCVAVIIATLTTAIALASVFSDFVSKDLLQEKVSYRSCLLVTAVLAFFVSTLEFSGIVQMLAPIVQTLYPMLLVLSVVNIVYRLWGKEVPSA